MRSKKLAVRFGLLTVLLISLSLASTSNAWSFVCPRPATPRYTWIPSWRGAVTVFILCDTPGATIYYTRAWDTTDPDDAPNPNFSSQTYRFPLYLTGDMVVKAMAYKDSWCCSYTGTLIVDFYPFSEAPQVN